LRLLARAADGSMRDALSLTDQAIAYSANQVNEEAVRGMLGALDQSYLIRLLDALSAGDGETVLSVADEMALRSLSFSTALQDLAGLLHRVAWAQFAPASVLDEWPEAEDIRRFADTLSAEQVQLFYQIATVGRSELGLAPDEYAGFTMTLLRMLAFEPAGGPDGGVSVNAPASGSARKAGAPAATAASGSAGRASGQAPRANETATTERAAPAAPTRTEAAPVMPVVSADAKRAEAGERAAASAEPVAPEPDAASADSTPADASTDPQPSLGGEESPDAPVAPIAAAAQQAATAAGRDEEPLADNIDRTVVSRAASGASAALEVLRSAGMRISSDRGARAAPATPKPVAPKPAAPAVQVPTPRRPAAAQPVESTPAAAPKRNAAASLPPWEDMPPDDFQPASAEDAYFMPPDDGFVPAFESGPDDLRFNATQPPAPKTDTRPLPPAVPLDAIGFAGDWPALAADLPLKGISYQLAFNSELTACDTTSISLSVPVPQYAEASQVAKLKAALADKLGRALEVSVTVGPARRTAAALDAAARAKRQLEAEQEIARDPFVQSLIRDFGASIVQGSIKPLASSGTAPGN
jgi:DNA polymerase-3 subunit gamma/tau